VTADRKDRGIFSDLIADRLAEVDAAIARERGQIARAQRAMDDRKAAQRAAAAPRPAEPEPKRE
jgi:hypothetical protein